MKKLRVGVSCQINNNKEETSGKIPQSEEKFNEVCNVQEYLEK